MKIVLPAIVLSIAFLNPTLLPHANANETVVLPGQTIVYLNQATIDAIELEIAKTTELAEKASAIRTLLKAEGEAKDGFCDTAVAAYSPAASKKADEVRELCMQVLTDDDTINGIASGEISKMKDPEHPDVTLREKLSQAISMFISLMSMMHG